MRTDVKIGIAVGLFLTVVAVAYFIVAGWDEPRNQVKPAAPDEPGAERVWTEAPGTGDTGLGATEEPAPGTADTGLPSGPIVIPRPEDIFDDSTPVPGEGPLAAGDRPELSRRDDAGSVGRTAEGATGDTTAEGSGIITPAPPALRPDTIDITGATTRRADNFYSNVQRIYVVQPGDNGFWTVSERMYGHGKYFGVIAEANSNVDSSSLHPGQRLVVPPLPEKYRRRAASPAPEADIITGERIYVVQKGDEGFWGVSVKVYGHGKYFKTIAKANPGVDPERLKAGQRLLIPRKPRDATTARVGLAAADLPPGYKIYVVQRGDAGFWDVAVRMYGNGRHFGLIARANLGVDSRRLQPGQKLRVPPLSEARRLTAATAPIIEDHAPGVTPVGTDAEPRPFFD